MAMVRHRVPLITQRTLALCWEAAGHMLYLWRHPGDEAGYRTAAGSFLRRSTGLREDQLAAFYVSRLGMVERSTTQLTGNLLARSPVITALGDDRTAHAVAIIGVETDDYRTFLISNPCLQEVIDFGSGAGSCTGGEVEMSRDDLVARLRPRFWYYA
jgi:hypothetical protein